MKTKCISVALMIGTLAPAVALADGRVTEGWRGNYPKSEARRGVVQTLESLTGIKGGWRVKFDSTTMRYGHWNASNPEFTRLAKAKSQSKGKVGAQTDFIGVVNVNKSFDNVGAHVQFPNVWGLERKGSYEDAVKAWRMEAIGR